MFSEGNYSKMLLLLGLITGAASFYFLLVKPLFYWKKLGVKQQNFLNAFLFNWSGILRSVSYFVKNMYDQFPNARFSGTYQFNKHALVLRDPELIKQILIKDFDHFTDRRTYVPEDVDPLWGKNLFSLRGVTWRNMRSTLSPAFTSSKMKGMYILMMQSTEIFINHFMKQDKNLITLEMKDTFTRFCNDVIASAAFGVEVNSLDNPKNEFFEMGRNCTDFNSFGRVLKFLSFMFVPKLSKLLNLKFFDDDVSIFFRNVIDETIELREKNGIVRPDMIHLLMEARSGVIKKEENDIADTGYATVEESIRGKISSNITNEDITAQALVFFFAGFESLSSLMSFMAYELAVNQDIQDKLRQEIRTISEKSAEKLTYDVLVNMKYMDMVVTEALRKWPPQVGAERICTKPYTIQPATPEEQPVHLKDGDLIIFPTFGIHRDPQYFPNPERFDPERFSDENTGSIKPFTYQPFGHGPRNCIGSRFALLETKVLFFHLLSNFALVPVEKTTIPLELASGSLFMNAKNGFWLGLERLNQK